MLKVSDLQTPFRFSSAAPFAVLDFILDVRIGHTFAIACGNSVT
jgi:hypothetical protein